MSAQPAATHPVLGAVADVRARLKDVAGVNPTFMEPAVQAVAMEGIAAARAQLDELELRVMAAAAAVAQTDAARDVAAWQVAHNHRDIRTARAEQRLAEALDRRYEILRAGMADGAVHLDQALVIARALDVLPDDLDPDTLAHAEVALVELAAHHTPKQLRILGERVLDSVDPEHADEVLARQLEAEEADAQRKTRLTFRPGGDGTTRITAVVPDATAARLKTYLDAFTSPRQGQLRGEGPHPRILGTAFCALLERLDPATLPQHGGRATTVLVTIPLASLREQLATGELIAGDTLYGGSLSATQIRRLACTAGIVPAVLGGRGEVLDLGREKRLFTPAQVKAMILNQRTCQAEGCDMPAAWCEVVFPGLSGHRHSGCRATGRCRDDGLFAGVQGPDRRAAPSGSLVHGPGQGVQSRRRRSRTGSGLLIGVMPRLLVLAGASSRTRTRSNVSRRS
ncbi:protein of unknown function [Nocardioides terrae]|uniref:DUF222 domain-containing protein n=1 Tax=Nocardioides terrae TaxID=574651 RepID=A0A1I1F285_9ACTN|nr:DUF222 domain-containing protein [Nocardioides terrae]SFB93052.1 protein of unknown function [Nocardioides terrae]